MNIQLEIGKYNENQDMSGFQKTDFSSIEEAIANIEFMKLGFNFFKNGESLVVRLEPGSKPYLIDSDSVIPINELKNELENKYQNLKIDEKEIIFAVTERKKETPLNSNFVFEEDENTNYATTTSGEKLPFRLFNSNDSETRSNLLWESGNPEQSTDFAFIERRFAENKSLQLFGNEKIENHNDVAWLFKSLEDEAIEHAFLVYHFEDKGYFVQHISTGTFNSSYVDNRVLIANILDATPSSITLVHNHPSGTLKVSRADSQCIDNLKKALKYSDVTVNHGVIINLRSGKYLIFDENSFEKIEERTKNNTELHEVQPYSFSKQVFVQNFQPIKVKSSKEVAEYISSQKFGISDKTELLILNSQLGIVGKFIMPPQNQVDFIIGKITKFGGANCILYGNNITPQEINFYNERLQFSNMSIVDGLLIKSENGRKIFKSFQDEKLLDNNIISHEINISTNEPSENLENYRQFQKQEYMENDKLYEINSFDRFEAFVQSNQQSSVSETVKMLNNLDFSDKKNYSLIDIKTGELIDINNPADQQLAISDFWTKELSNRTDLSSGLNYNQIDEKQAAHFRNYEAEFAKLDIDQKVQNTGYLTHEEIMLIVPEERHGNDFHIKVSKEEAEYLIKKDIISDVMNAEYGDDSNHWVGMTKDNFDEETNSFDSEYQTFEINVHPITKFELEALLVMLNLSMKTINEINLSVERNAIKFAEHILDNAKISNINEFKDYFKQLNSTRKEIFSDVMTNHFHAKLTDENKVVVSKISLSEALQLGNSFLSGDVTTENKTAQNFNNIELIGGKIKDIAVEAIQNPAYLKQFDQNTQNAINEFIKSQNINNQNPKIMETQKDFDMVKHLQNQLKYLGFGEGEKLHKDLENGINSASQAFEVKTSSDKVLPGNTAAFSINFSKSDNGGVFLNSYDANLSNEKGEVSHKFYVNKDNAFTAKEAINLLEGRTVKTEFHNPKSDQIEPVFVKINFDEPKTEKGNFQYQNFYKNYGVNTDQIVEKSNLIFDKPEYKENTIKSLEKGNVVKVKFQLDDKVVEGKAVLNPQYKNLNLYDNDMTRINTNKPLEGLDNDNKHEKSNVREQSMSRGI